MDKSQIYDSKPESPTRDPAFYLERHKRRQGRGGPGGGKMERFARIAAHVPVSVAQVVQGDIPDYVVNEYHWMNRVHGAVSPASTAGIILCVYCNRNLREFRPDDRTEDHVHPRFLGGADLGRDNLVPACGPCNRAKANHPLLMFLARRREGKPSQ